MLKNNINALFNPSHYHGWAKSKKFFEGWYYKLINDNEDHAFAVIPGIAMDENGNKQAFIQILDGKKLTAAYHKFDAASFKPSEDKFEVQIEDNYFSSNQLKLNLPNLKADLHFKDMKPWPSSWYSPGIMGPFSFVPFMECRHGVLSLDHEISGIIKYDNTEINFDKGRGYLEKDWGSSFPSAYIWMQSNHFAKKEISFKASVAKIPFMGTSFVGFIAGLYFDQKLIQFTTYNFTKLKKSFADEEKVELILSNFKHKLIVSAEREEATSLASPIAGFMDGRIEESMEAVLNVELIDNRSGQQLFKGAGRNAGLEVAGKIKEIIV